MYSYYVCACTYEAMWLYQVLPLCLYMDVYGNWMEHTGRGLTWYDGCQGYCISLNSLHLVDVLGPGLWDKTEPLWTRGKGATEQQGQLTSTLHVGGEVERERERERERNRQTDRHREKEVRRSKKEGNLKGDRVQLVRSILFTYPEITTDLVITTLL